MGSTVSFIHDLTGIGIYPFYKSSIIGKLKLNYLLTLNRGDVFLSLLLRASDYFSLIFVGFESLENVRIPCNSE